MLPSLHRKLIKLKRSFHILKERLHRDIKLPEKLAFLEVFVLELAAIFVATAIANELVNLATYHLQKYPSLTFNTSGQFVINICT